MITQDTRVVRWGILSTANIGRRVIPAIQQSRNGQVAVVASRDLARARAFAAELNVPRAVGSYDELLADPDVDAVYIPLPNNLHRPWTIRAAEQGKHVLCEKPLALTASECDDMIAACQAGGLRFMEAFMYRFHPQIQTVQALVADGAVGEVRLIRNAFSFSLRRPHDIRLDKDLGGGALMDVGCYCVNAARLVTGAEPVEVQAVAHLGAESGVDETLAGLLRFPRGELAMFDCSFRYPFRQEIEIVGTEGVVEVPAPFTPGVADATVRLRRNDQIESITVPGVNHYTLMAEHFSDSILTDAGPRWPASDGRANMKAIEALYLAARTGKRLRVD